MVCYILHIDFLSGHLAVHSTGMYQCHSSSRTGGLWGSDYQMYDHCGGLLLDGVHQVAQKDSGEQHAV